MSRSYKKNPYYTDSVCGGTKKRKQMANRKVRHSDDIPPHSGYKKLYCSWAIRDYVQRLPWEKAKEEWEINLKRFYPSFKEFYLYWLKCYKLK